MDTCVCMYTYGYIWIHVYIWIHAKTRQVWSRHSETDCPNAFMNRNAVHNLARELVGVLHVVIQRSALGGPRDGTSALGAGQPRHFEQKCSGGRGGSNDDSNERRHATALFKSVISVLKRRAPLLISRYLCLNCGPYKPRFIMRVISASFQNVLGNIFSEGGRRAHLQW